MKLLRYAKGFLKIKIWGNGVERFIDLCANNNLYLWNIQIEQKYVYLNIHFKDFYRTKKLAKKSGIRAVVAKRYGLPFFIPIFLQRYLLILGIFLISILVILSEQFLFHIESNGNIIVSTDELLDFLSAKDVHLGIRLKNVELEEIENNIRKNFDVITWVSARLDGTKLLIDIKENEKVNLIQGREIIDRYSGLYSNVDGIVRFIYVRKGVPMVAVGDSVCKEELLVDGKVPIYNQELQISGYHYYESDADIWIETTVPISLVLDEFYKEKLYTGRTNSGVYFGINNKIYRNKLLERKFLYEDLELVYKNMLCLTNVTFTIGRFYAKEYKSVERAYSKNEAEQLLYQKFDKNNEILLEKGVQILEKDVTMNIIMGKWTLQGEMRVIIPAFYSKNGEISEELDDSGSI